jgi:hypothetical protein
LNLYYFVGGEREQEKAYASPFRNAF